MLPHSKILIDENIQKEFKNMINDKIDLQIIYQGSEDGFKAKIFH